MPQKSSLDSIKRTNNWGGSENAYSELLAEDAFSRKVSVSVADAGETAVVVSMGGGNQWTAEPKDTSLSMVEVEKGYRSDALNPHAKDPKADSQAGERTDTPSMFEARELELSLSHDASFSLPSIFLGYGELKTGCADEKMNEQSSCDGVKSSSSKSCYEFYTGNKLSENESNIGLHLGLSVGSFLSGNFASVIIVHVFVYSKISNFIITAHNLFSVLMTY